MTSTDPVASHSAASHSADSDAGETDQERVQRNWTEILQELRVIQTGSQILTGFLLTLAFQPTFADLDPVQRTLYLALVVTAALTTILGLAPVSLHRALFRQGAKETIVQVADVVLKVTLTTVGLTLTGTVGLIFDVVLGPTPALIAGGLVLAVVIVAWIAVPVTSLRRIRD